MESLLPRRHPGEYVYTRVDAIPAGAQPVVTVQEAEGTTLVLERTEADALGLAYDFVAAWITLDLDTELELVGLTAAFSTALAAGGIPANVVAGFAHDHIFVPVADAGAAEAILAALTAEEGFEAIGDDIGASITVISSVLTKGRGPRLHRHPYEEVFVVLAGEAEFTVGDDTSTARAGDVLVAPAGVPHAFTATGQGTYRAVDIHVAPRFDTEYL